MVDQAKVESGQSHSLLNEIELVLDFGRRWSND
jgi:hypothetical protein